jgi:DNA-directed RNA polymerase alpha subunit
MEGSDRINPSRLPSYEELISDLSVVPDLGGTSNVSFTFNSPNERLLNYLYVALVENVPTYAVEFIVFHVNKTIRTPEGIAHAVGLIPLSVQGIEEMKNRQNNQSDELKVRADLSSGEEYRPIYAKDIDLPWVDGSEMILMMEPGQRLAADFIVKSGTGAEHVKWRPVVQFHWEKRGDVFHVEFTNIGQLDPETVLRQGVASIFKVYDRKPESIYFRLAKP